MLVMKTILSISLCTALVLMLAAGCKSSRESAAEGELHSFQSLARGYQTGLSGSSLRVARTSDQWMSLWNEHSSRVIPRPTAPQVDWSTQMVVCAVVGTRATAGYGVQVERLVRRADKLIVEARETTPAADAVVPQVITQPYHMITTARFDGPLELLVR